MKMGPVNTSSIEARRGNLNGSQTLIISFVLILLTALPLGTCQADTKDKQEDNSGYYGGWHR